jgi:hypothetical protein
VSLGVLTRSDPAVRKTLARLRLQRWRMRRAGIGLAIEGAKVTPAAKTDIRRTFRRVRKAMEAA